MNEIWITHTYKTHHGLDLGGIITLFLTLNFFIGHMVLQSNLEKYENLKMHRFY